MIIKGINSGEDERQAAAIWNIRIGSQTFRFRFTFTRGPAHRNEAGLWVRFPPSFDSCVWKTWLKENQGEGVSVQ